MKILHVVGARPNYMKIAPIMAQMARQPFYFQQVLVHTGQHYDVNMSDLFFDDLGISQPDYCLEVGSGSHAEQTARVMMKFEPIVLKEWPDLVLVVGDVNSTIACALVCSKLSVPIGHVEAGLRSYDRTMPEEINRVLTDQISDLLFTPSPEAETNLVNEGISRKNIFYVGNVMIDTLIRLLPASQGRWLELRKTVAEKPFVLVTLHRPSNVDAPQQFDEIMSALIELSNEMLILFPVHPRTLKRLENFNLNEKSFRLMEPLGYLDFLALQQHAAIVITDSGGVQEETSFLGVPCLTVRSNTERPITLKLGTNRLVSPQKDILVEAVNDVLRQKQFEPVQIPLWDGHASERIVNAILEWHFSKE